MRMLEGDSRVIEALAGYHTAKMESSSATMALSADLKKFAPDIAVRLPLVA